MERECVDGGTKIKYSENNLERTERRKWNIEDGTRESTPQYELVEGWKGNTEEGTKGRGNEDEVRQQLRIKKGVIEVLWV